MLDPFPPRQHRRSHESQQEFPCRPQAWPESPAFGPGRVPQHMIEHPTHDFPGGRDRHGGERSTKSNGIQRDAVVLSPGNERLRLAPAAAVRAAAAVRTAATTTAATISASTAASTAAMRWS